jgi:hypothetical protein
MFRGPRMQPAECRNRRQLGMELHQQWRILDTLGQAVLLLFQLCHRGAIGANQMQPSQANQDWHQRGIIPQLAAELPGALEVLFEFVIREPPGRRQRRAHKLSQPEFQLPALRCVREGLEQC